MHRRRGAGAGSARPGGVSGPRSATAWAIRYGLPGLVIRTSARRGDLIARTTVDPVLLADPFEAYDEMRARCPIVANRGISATAHHHVANRILRDDAFLAGPAPAPTRLLERVLSAAIDPRALGPSDPPSLLAIHPPQHARIRKLVSHAFTPRSIAALAPRIQDVAGELLDHVATGPERFDLIGDYAALLPVTVIAEIIGVPAGMRRQFLEWGNQAALTLDPGLSWRDYRSAERAIRESHDWLDLHIARLRRHPGSDLLSQLIAVRDGSDRLSDTELRVTTLLLLGAGFETTVNLIGNAVRLLLAHPDQLAALREKPEGWGNAVDEVLRYDSPVQITLRTAKADTEVAGQTIRAGRSVVVSLGGANRDPAVFTDPHRFDVTRPNAREHLAFSAGIHYCLGAQLARLEASIALQALFERFPSLALSGTPTRRGTRVLRGYEHLPVARATQPSSRAASRDAARSMRSSG